MEAAWVDSGLLDALTRRAGRSLQTENAVQRDPHSRRIRGQSATWRTALWAAFATALIFLVVKCTVRLPNRAEASVRMLAEGGGDWDDGERQPLLQRVRLFTHSRCSSAFFDRVDLTFHALHCLSAFFPGFRRRGRPLHDRDRSGTTWFAKGRRIFL